MNGAVFLTVVVVTYNEADRIGDCLESVFSACASVGELEVIVVDGNSTDDTVAIASDYPVFVLRTTEEMVSSPSSGRYVGTALASGEYVLYVDGDTEVADGWIETAIGRLERRATLVGVGGYFNDYDGPDDPEEADWLWRTAVYDLEAIREVGSFDPYLSALEDFEVGFRLSQAGYELQRLPVVVGYHPDSSGIGESLRRWHQGFYHGHGEILRKYLHEPSRLLPWLGRLRLLFATVGWLSLGLVATLVGSGLGLGWLLATAALAVLALRRRGARWLREALVSQVVLRPLGLVCGFLQYPTSSPEYPVDSADIVHKPDDSKPRV